VDTLVDVLVDVEALVEVDVDTLYDETVDAEDCVGVFKLGGILLVVGRENCVPVVVTTVDGNTVAAVF